MLDESEVSSGCLPPGLQLGNLAWDDIEANWSIIIAQARADEDFEIQQEYEREAEVVRQELIEALNQHTRLTEALLQARVLVDEKYDDLDYLAAKVERRKQATAEKRARDDSHFAAWVKDCRSADTSHQDCKTPHREEASPSGGEVEISEIVGQRGHQRGRRLAEPTRSPPQTGSSARATSNSISGRGQDNVDGEYNSIEIQGSADESGPLVVEVVNSDGTEIGTVKRSSATNHWIQNLLALPLRRRVEIRYGRKLTQIQLDAIYEGGDQKKSKWLSFMIQATGELQSKACQTCSKGQGLYSHCVIVGGSEFPRCGNCEWNKQGCNGAVAPNSHSASPSLSTSIYFHQHRQKQGPQTSSRSIPFRVGTPGSLASSKGTATPDTKQRRGHSDKDKQRRSRVKEKPFSSRRSDATLKTTSLPEQVDLSEITKECLVLKDDGMIFLEPEIMRGVPIRKISPDHAYWEPEWKPVEEAIRTKLDEWMAKLAALKEMPEADLTEKDKTAIFQAGRQVNRGKGTLKILLGSDFHPFQLIGKQWITPALVHYDTLYRMAATLDELAKFRIEVTPLQWLRHRLYEIYMQNPAEFKLDRVVAKLYHDPKLTDLRSKNGFGNIGRPSTGARSRNTVDPGSTGSTSRSKVGEKRKDMPTGPGSVTSTPTKRIHTDEKRQSGNESAGRQHRQSRQQQAHQKQLESSSPTGNGKDHNQSSHSDLLQSSHRMQSSTKSREVQPSAPGFSITSRPGSKTPNDDLEYSGYTSTDSLTNDDVVERDWRVYQVKTMRLTSNTRTTQYWHWVDEKYEDCESMFEHQVLKETEPSTSWGVFKEPVDFHLRLRELTDIAYARDSQKVVIGTRQVEGVEWRGNVLAYFKRERTKRRFLAFMKKSGVDLARTQGAVIEEEWNRMQSGVMPGGDSD